MSREMNFYRELPVLEREEAPLDREERLKAMAGPLLEWYSRRARSLPWREDPRPYRVWVSEIMLQQTRVEAVKPYFERFMAALPEIAALAEAPDDLLLKLWEGLGYYSRVRNLKRAAQQVMQDYGGELPPDAAALQTLPGIGSYTAGAIASIAYQIPVPAVDGNVLRVISRVMGDRGDIRQSSVKAGMERELQAIMPKRRAGDYNQALIELGALVCIPAGEPRCAECPLYSLCRTGQAGLWREIPFKSPPKARKQEEKTVFLIETPERVAIGKRPAKGLLAGLYEFPNREGRVEAEQAAEALGIPPELVTAAEALPEATHIFSHVEWHMTGCRLRLKAEAEPLWEEQALLEGYFLAPRRELTGKYAIPKAFWAYERLLRENG